MKIYTNDEIDKIELSLTLCKYLKRYNLSLYESIFGYGNGADYNFIRKMYYQLDTKNDFIKRLYNILYEEFFIVLDMLDDYPADTKEYIEILTQVHELEYLQEKLKEYF